MFPISALFRDISVFQVGPVFITSYKLLIMVAGFMLLKYLFPEFLKNNTFFSKPLSLFIYLNIYILFSIFNSSTISSSQKINYSLLSIAEIVIIIGLSQVLIRQGNYRIISGFRSVLVVLFLFELGLATLQLIFKDQLIRNVGIIPDQLPYTITGLNYERLFLCEFLTLGLAVILLEKRYKPTIRVALSAAVAIIVYLSDSLTGMLGLVSLLIIIPRIRIRSLVVSIVTLTTLITIILPSVSNKYLSESQILYRQQRRDYYFKEYEFKNWRYFSSVALLREVYSNPTFFGHGYKSNERFLYPYFDDYSYGKFGSIGKERKEVSPHSFISIVYDLGFIGFILFLFMLFHLIKSLYYIYKYSSYGVDNNQTILFKLTCVFTWLVILRYGLYYHSINHWHYLIGIVFINTSYLLIKKSQQLNENPHFLT